MLRTKPIVTYCGLTVILSNPSRFDLSRLLSATGGHLFNDFCLRPDYNVMMCDIRVMEDSSPFLAGTKCVLLLGEGAMHSWLPFTIKNSLGELRGSPFTVRGIPCICSYFPQDAADSRAWEQTHNPLSKDYTIDDENQDEKEEYDSVKRHGSTKRSNYAFWLRADVRKCKQILKSGVPVTPPERQPIYIPDATPDELISVLTTIKGTTLFFDIETDYEEQNLQCFSFSFDGHTIYGCVVLSYTYSIASPRIPAVLRALAIAIRDNTLIAHNGATFDFFVLAHKYHIPINKTYDTLIAQHRCFPDVEKSLGHCVSLWTWERFHKDEDSTGYMTFEQQRARVSYCCKDVYTLALVYYAIESYAKSVPGLKDSIDTAMRCIKPYLITSLQGIRVNTPRVIELAREADSLMMQYNRIIRFLIGPIGEAEIQSYGKTKSMLAGSNKQCCTYFHTILGYDVVARSLKTQEPSLAKKAMFKLRLKYENPVMDFIIGFRTVQKEYSAYKFIPWKLDDGTPGKESILTYDNNTPQCPAPESQPLEARQIN